ncbi:pantetheine-phosphate adenylyltransferase [bacterium]|nr:MAG: pantetheine-phosphate adenylyltransferase [bacterium]
MTLALYAGSFDPFTKGHQYVVDQTLKRHDNLIILIAVNPGKKYMFTDEERRQMILDCLPADLSGRGKNVEVVILPSGKLVIDYARARRVTDMIRGMRSPSDFVEEQGLFTFNESIYPSVLHWFVMPPYELGNTSSTWVKYYWMGEDWETKLPQLVPPPVFERLKEKKNEQ